jgi:hypothetical protein
METQRFDTLTRQLNTDGSSRRGLLRGLAATALGLAAVRFPGAVTARRKRKGKTPRVNAFGCLNVGQKCGGASGLCCSGICQGKKPKKGKPDKRRCVAHNALDCQAAADSCAGDAVPCGTAGACTLTTGAASFCSATGDGACAACQTDADCEASRGPGAACIVCPGNCPDTATACFAAGV